MSLMRRDDLVNLYIEAMQSDSFSGVYNATAPNPVRMSELCSSLGSVLGRPSWLPVPDFALQVCAFPCSGLCMCSEHALCTPASAAHAKPWPCSRLQQDMKHGTPLGSRINFGICCLQILVSALRMPVLVQALLGGGASVVLEGQRVIPFRAQDAGFHFQYSHVNQAIANIYR